MKYVAGFSQKICDNNFEVRFEIQEALSASQLEFSPKTNKIKLNMSVASFTQKTRTKSLLLFPEKQTRYGILQIKHERSKALHEIQESVIIPRGKDDILHTSRLSPFSFYG
jgi:hypothetical protein